MTATPTRTRTVTPALDDETVARIAPALARLLRSAWERRDTEAVPNDDRDRGRATT